VIISCLKLALCVCYVHVVTLYVAQQNARLAHSGAVHPPPTTAAASTAAVPIVAAAAATTTAAAAAVTSQQHQRQQALSTSTAATTAAVLAVGQPLAAVPPAAAVQNPGYRDPSRSEGVFTFAADIYSLGIIMLQLLTGQSAYDATAMPSCLSARLNSSHVTAESDLQVCVVLCCDDHRHCSSIYCSVLHEVKLKLCVQ
jgi:serine/threonine protein kinase